MFGRKKGSTTPAPPIAAASASETLANSPVRERGGLLLHKPQPARPQPTPQPATHGVPNARPPTISMPAAPRPLGATVSTTQGDGKILVVGRAIALSGEIGACDKLIVEGRVSAELHRCRHIEITRTGRFSGVAEVETAEIVGRFDGELTARRVVVRPSARMSGKIRYGQLIVEPGAQIRGDISPLEPDVLVEEPA
jgi:cytoskeletal protein CcmA (bactofilin family)